MIWDGRSRRQCSVETYMSLYLQSTLCTQITHLFCSLRWKVMAESTVCWFVVREKHCSSWKNKLKSTNYKTNEQDHWIVRLIVFAADKHTDVILLSEKKTVAWQIGTSTQEVAVTFLVHKAQFDCNSAVSQSWPPPSWPRRSWHRICTQNAHDRRGHCEADTSEDIQAKRQRSYTPD
jgi:hypothetical protein